MTSLPMQTALLVGVDCSDQGDAHWPKVAGYELASVVNTYRGAPRADPWRLPSRPAVVNDTRRPSGACRGLPVSWCFPSRGEDAGRAKAMRRMRGALRTAAE